MKTKFLRRLLALCLALILVCGLSSAAWAADELTDSGTTDTGVVWTLKANGTLTLNGKGSLFKAKKDLYADDEPILAPWYPYFPLIRKIVISNGITEIPDSAFTGCVQLTTVSFPKTLKKIDGFAFSYCPQLKKFALPASVTCIDSSAFDDTGWYKAQKDGVVYCGNHALTWKGEKEPSVIKIRKGTMHISPRLFSWKRSLKTIVLPDGLKTIGDLAFSSSGLTSVTIPSSVISIGSNALNDCNSLKTIKVASGNKTFSADQNVALYNKKKATLLQYAIGSSLTSYTVKKGTKAIGDYAFQFADKLKKITIANAVKTIGESAFSGCEVLKSIHIPDNVKSIGDFAFFNGYQLTSVTGGKGVSKLGRSVLSDTLWYYQHENGPLYIGSVLAGYIGFYSGAKTFRIKEGTTAIAPKALESVGKYLQNVSLPSTLKTIGDSAFYNAKIKSLTIPGSVERIEDSAFYHCTNLKAVKFNEGLQVIEEYAFSNCASLTDVRLPNSLKKLGSNAFEQTGLSKLRLPAGLQTIEDVPATGKTFSRYLVDEANSRFSADENGLLFNKNKTVLLLCPSGFSQTSITVPAGVTAIGDDAFRGMKKLTGVVLPEGLRTIGANAFLNCLALKSINLPDSIETIGPSAFCSCESLASVKLPSKLKILSDGVFTGCKALTAIKIPGSVRFVDSFAFALCKKLKKVVIAEGVRSITMDAFYGCTALTGVTLPKSLRILDPWAFCECKGLQKIIIKNKKLYITEYDEEYEGRPFSKKVTLCAPAGSTTQSYCKSHKLKFQAV